MTSEINTRISTVVYPDLSDNALQGLSARPPDQGAEQKQMCYSQVLYIPLFSHDNPLTVSQHRLLWACPSYIVDRPSLNPKHTKGPTRAKITDGLAPTGVSEHQGLSARTLQSWTTPAPALNYECGPQETQPPPVLPEAYRPNTFSLRIPPNLPANRTS